ncbi:hypothetical protein AAON49_08435 [Pseudotenacibaculum sp. MALMAid0570]|uniref:hypothetical protein n=1 Tax=Pseudotenacibaculum sp. MALMAid0570 TaxID=3143938 RepID=UPI0032DE40F9
MFFSSSFIFKLDIEIIFTQTIELDNFDLKSHRAKHIEGKKIIAGRFNITQWKSSKEMYFILSLLLLLLTFLYILNNSRDRNLKKNGIVTEAIVKNIVSNAYIMNELDATGPDNYHIIYTFKVDKYSFDGLYEILKEDYSKYFKERLKINDTIKIIYDRRNPTDNKILMIDKN